MRKMCSPGLREVVLRHVDMLEPRESHDIYALVLGDWGSVSHRQVIRALSELREDGKVSYGDIGWLRLKRPKETNAERTARYRAEALKRGDCIVCRCRPHRPNRVTCLRCAMIQEERRLRLNPNAGPYRCSICGRDGHGANIHQRTNGEPQDQAR